MREIKFRAWDKMEKQMCPVTRVIFRQPTGYDFINVRIKWNGKIIDQGGFIGKDNTYILMQYTGAKDKNGVEIYEGDVIHWDPVRPVESYTPTYAKTKRLDDYIIQWNAARCEFWAEPGELGHAYMNISQSDLSMNWKVIGNIYENPELVGNEENS